MDPAACRAAILITRGHATGQNDHNGRHELHDVNAPPTARRPGLNLILIKSNKSTGESSRRAASAAAVLFREGPSRRTVAVERLPTLSLSHSSSVALSLYLSPCLFRILARREARAHVPN